MSMKGHKLYSTITVRHLYKSSFLSYFSAQSHLVNEKGEIFDYRQIEGNADTNIVFQKCFLLTLKICVKLN